MKAEIDGESERNESMRVASIDAFADYWSPCRWDNRKLMKTGTSALFFSSGTSGFANPKSQIENPKFPDDLRSHLYL